MKFKSNDDSLEGAKAFDQEDSLTQYRPLFCLPECDYQKPVLYFAGHSLGPMPKSTPEIIKKELDHWSKYAVEGHFKGEHPWMSYHEALTPMLARLLGAKENEVVAMNSLTVNLHLMLVSFYRPTKERHKILIENNTFPSDHYAVQSQARFHGFDPQKSIIELEADVGKITVTPDRLLEQIDIHKNELCLVMLGNCNYLSGQAFDIESIVKTCHQHGILVGFNLAHGAGNLLLDLHRHQLDFAVACSYKYLNSGPGGMSAVFVHENHLGNKSISRFEGWWGQNKSKRFLMEKEFNPIESVESWQLSNPPIFQLAAMENALKMFDQASMASIRKKGDHLTAYLEFLIQQRLSTFCEIITPAFDPKSQVRGSMLSIRFKSNAQNLLNAFEKQGIILDFRQPDILRITPAPLYNTYQEVFQLVELMEEVVHEK